MQDIITQPMALTLFYLTMLGQIFLISVYFPRRIVARGRYLIDTYPATTYPHLYPKDLAAVGADGMHRKLTRFLAICYAIAGLGVALLIVLLFNGYRMADKGGDEIFVLLAFLVQSLPIMLIMFRESRQAPLLRKAFKARTRQADLRPRRLFDFVSPLLVGSAVILFGLWLYVYLGSRDITRQPLPEIIATVGGMSLMNILFAIGISRVLSGNKLNPFMASADKRKYAGIICRSLLMVSCIASLFLMMTQAADTYALEIVDPVITSLYMQLCTWLGLGLSMDGLKIEDMDFEAYRDTDLDGEQTA